MTTADPNGINVRNVERWFAENVPQATAPFTYELIAGGHSNLTYRVIDAEGKRFVLRRPPLGHVLATAHDMGREWRAITALRDTPVPVAPALGFCEDIEVNDAPFYVMDFVDGYVQNSIAETRQFGSPERNALSGESLFDVLADLHAVDVDAVGLRAHGPSDGYVERQVRRWYKQFTAMKNKEIPAVDTVYQRLLDHLPANTEVTVVHGDYRLGNCITGFDGTIAAVLDWEISTLGDPLADLAYLANTWSRPGNDLAGLPDSQNAPTMAEGFRSREELLERYAHRSGRDLSKLDYYVAFNSWKTACIVQGVLSRYLGGALGDTSNVDLAGFERTIAARSALALEATERFV